MCIRDSLRRPLSDTPDRGEPSDDFFVAFPGQPARLEYHSAVENLGGEVLQRENLVAREAGGPQLFCRGGKETLGGCLLYTSRCV